jgi:hypothetical protein
VPYRTTLYKRDNWVKERQREQWQLHECECIVDSKKCWRVGATCRSPDALGNRLYHHHRPTVTSHSGNMAISSHITHHHHRLNKQQRATRVQAVLTTRMISGRQAFTAQHCLYQVADLPLSLCQHAHLHKSHILALTPQISTTT